MEQPIDTTNNENMSTLPYTIIRVKRKLEIATNASQNTDRYQSFKKLRHIGSFSATKTNESILSSGNLLKQMGLSAQKRVRISDFDPEQFDAYVQRLNEEPSETKKLKEDSDVEPNKKDISYQHLPNDTTIFDSDHDIENKENNENMITCNGQILQPITTKVEEYVYDYYVLMDQLMDFSDDSDNIDQGLQFDDAASNDSNDEHYRYNDYPDEDEFSDQDDRSESSSYDDEKEELYDENFDRYNEEDEEDEDMRDICNYMVRKMKLSRTIDSDHDDDDEDDDEDN